jgi:hypothetical protein
MRMFICARLDWFSEDVYDLHETYTARLLYDFSGSVSGLLAFLNCLNGKHIAG